MSPEDLAAARLSIMRHEGFSAVPTPDAHGTLVIGYGRNLNRNPLTIPEGEYLLDQDLPRRLAGAITAWPPLTTCSGPQQQVVLELTYQLGIGGLLLFKDFLHALAVKDVPAAVQALQASQLAQQTPSRVRDYCDRLTQG